MESEGTTADIQSLDLTSYVKQMLRLLSLRSYLVPVCPVVLLFGRLLSDVRDSQAMLSAFPKVEGLR